MRNIWLGVLLLASNSLAFGQLSSYSITIAASRSTVLQADQAVFGVNVTSNLSTGLDQVVTALQGSGITSTNLSSVLTEQSNSNTVLAWSFTLPVPLAQVQTTITALLNVQEGILKSKNGLVMGFSLQGTQVSQQLLASQTCPIPALVADAQAQAQKVAGAAGFRVGPVQAISSTNSSAAMGSGTFAGLLLDPFPSTISTILTAIQPFSGPPAALNCSIVVKFGLVTS